MSSDRSSEPEGHEKYGVVTEESKTAAAQATGLCPQCATKLVVQDDHRNVPWCPHCGTYPFENR